MSRRSSRSYTPVPRRPMTDAEQRMAVALGACRFVPQTFEKRVARELGAVAASDDPRITEKQAVLLGVLTRKYRRQIPADVVALAGPGPTRMPAAPEPPPAAVPLADSVETPEPRDAPDLFTMAGERGDVG